MQSLVHLFVFAFPYLIFIDATTVQSVHPPSAISAFQDQKSNLTDINLPKNGTLPADNSTVVMPTLPPQPQPPSPITTPAPLPPAPYVPDRKFDGPSFIGGMVLCGGLTAIGFVSWKFYKARVELTYRTL
ncbi:hypothetical protein WDU94_009446 [Cyamophila willieti]